MYYTLYTLHYIHLQYNSLNLLFIRAGRKFLKGIFVLYLYVIKLFYFKCDFNTKSSCDIEELKENVLLKLQILLKFPIIKKND